MEARANSPATREEGVATNDAIGWMKNFRQLSIDRTEKNRTSRGLDQSSSRSGSIDIPDEQKVAIDSSDMGASESKPTVSENDNDLSNDSNGNKDCATEEDRRPEISDSIPANNLATMKEDDPSELILSGNATKILKKDNDVSNNMDDDDDKVAEEENKPEIDGSLGAKNMDTMKKDDTAEMNPSSNGPEFSKKDKDVSGDIDGDGDSAAEEVDEDGDSAAEEGNITEIVCSLGEGSLTKMNEDDPEELSGNEPKISKHDKEVFPTNDLEDDKDRVNEEDSQPEIGSFPTMREDNEPKSIISIMSLISEDDFEVNFFEEDNSHVSEDYYQTEIGRWTTLKEDMKQKKIDDERAIERLVDEELAINVEINRLKMLHEMEVEKGMEIREKIKFTEEQVENRKTELTKIGNKLNMLESKLSESKIKTQHEEMLQSLNQKTSVDQKLLIAKKLVAVLERMKMGGTKKDTQSG